MVTVCQPLTCPACQSTSMLTNYNSVSCVDCNKSFKKDLKKEVATKKTYRRRFLAKGQPHRNLDQYDGTYIG